MTDIKKITILIVEDSSTQAEKIKYLLEKHNYSVFVAINGNQALDILDKQKISMIISDIIMPGMNGFELCEAIKSNDHSTDIPVILLTALSEAKELLHGLSCGANSFITKPYNEEYLLTHIEKILSEKRIRNQKKDFGWEGMVGGKKKIFRGRPTGCY